MKIFHEAKADAESDATCVKILYPIYHFAKFSFNKAIVSLGMILLNLLHYYYLMLIPPPLISIKKSKIIKIRKPSEKRAFFMLAAKVQRSFDDRALPLCSCDATASAVHGRIQATLTRSTCEQSQQESKAKFVSPRTQS